MKALHSPQEESSYGYFKPSTVLAVCCRHDWKRFLNKMLRMYVSVVFRCCLHGKVRSRKKLLKFLRSLFRNKVVNLISHFFLQQQNDFNFVGMIPVYLAHIHVLFLIFSFFFYVVSSVLSSFFVYLVFWQRRSAETFNEW